MVSVARAPEVVVEYSTLDEKDMPVYHTFVGGVLEFLEQMSSTDDAIQIRQYAVVTVLNDATWEN